MSTNRERVERGRRALLPYLSGERPLPSTVVESVTDLLADLGHFLADQGTPRGSIAPLLEGCVRVAVDHFHFEIRPGNPARRRISLADWQARQYRPHRAPVIPLLAGSEIIDAEEE